DNRASAEPLSRFGLLPSFPKAGKGERASVFHGESERQLGSGGFAPLVKSARGNQATAFCESPPKRGFSVSNSWRNSPRSLKALMVTGKSLSQRPHYEMSRRAAIWRFQRSSTAVGSWRAKLMPPVTSA